ncbi:hypothetical protein [Euzebyella saccharophila]|uniref:Lipoprotein n=1 Tax=Euzebyella saccharophila TaxID=679664 RepID=A0ABV8JIH1_9FLAO|nr:hypothetical protein [Euzebyella saccharophila]
MKKIILLTLIMFSSCKDLNKTDYKVEEKLKRTDFGLANSDFTIIKFNPEWYWIFQDEKPTATELSLDELSKIEPILKKAIAKHNEGLETDSRWRLELKGYKRQYVATLNEKGEKEIWLNFFCQDFQFDKWRTEIPLVADGGNCFFNIKINLATKSYKDLRINSIA